MEPRHINDPILLFSNFEINTSHLVKDRPTVHCSFVSSPRLSSCISMYNTTLVPACSVYFGTGEQIEFAVSNFYGLLSLTLYFLEAKVILFTIRFNYPFYYQFVYLSGVVSSKEEYCNKERV